MKKYKIIYADCPEKTEGWDVWGGEVESDIELDKKL